VSVPPGRPNLNSEDVQMAEVLCPGCGEPAGPGEQTCQKCGKPLSFEPDQNDVPCRVCGTLISAYTQQCPECGEGGYPALRPRRGKGFKGPDAEI